MSFLFRLQDILRTAALNINSKLHANRTEGQERAYGIILANNALSDIISPAEFADCYVVVKGI